MGNITDPHAHETPAERRQAATLRKQLEDQLKTAVHMQDQCREMHSSESSDVASARPPPSTE